MSWPLSDYNLAASGPLLVLIAAALLMRARRPTTAAVHATPKSVATDDASFSRAATPPPAAVGPATIISTFSLHSDGTITEPSVPLYHPPRLPHDLSSRRYAHPATEAAALALKLLRLDSALLLDHTAAWHSQRGTAATWKSATASVSVVARRSTLLALWHGTSMVRARRQNGMLFLDRASAVVGDAAASRHGRAALMGRRFEAAATHGGQPGAALMAVARVVLPSSEASKLNRAGDMLLFTEVDCAEPGSWLAAEEAWSGEDQNMSGLGLLELKARTCAAKSAEFAARGARDAWAQCVLGAVSTAVIGERTAGGRLLRLHKMSVDELADIARRGDPAWAPESAMMELSARVAFVVSHAVEGGDFEVYERHQETPVAEGPVRLELRERATRRVIAVSAT